MPEVLLSIVDAQVSHGPLDVINGVSLSIASGEIVALIGANGAGKTTLLMSIFGKPRIKSGDILFEGQSIRDFPTHAIGALGIAIAPEGRRIFPKMTVEENLLMGAVRVRDAQTIKNSLTEAYVLFPILAERKHTRAGLLSGGEQQMLAMGRALMAKPRLFLLDEPSLGLAPRAVDQVYDVLREIAQRGTTILLVEQNTRRALTVADRAYVLANGVVQLSGKAADLLNDDKVKACYLGI